MGKEKRKAFFAHQQFNKKIERERKNKQLEEEQRRRQEEEEAAQHQQQEEEEAAQQQQLEELEKAQQRIQNLQRQLAEAQLRNDALEAANRDNQRENIWLNEQVRRVENNARQRQYRRGHSRKGN